MKKGIKLFGLTPSYQESEIALLAVPWSVTSSFGGGAELGPDVIAHRSSQMDFFSVDMEDIRDRGIFFQSPPEFLKTLNRKARIRALPVIQMEENAPGDCSKELINEVNTACAQMVEWVYEEVKRIHQDQKKCGLVGGDHSISEGAIRYFSKIYNGDLGVLHIDAHADLRKAYQGFHYSHASVMYNVVHHKYSPSCLVQVGIRDYCKEEFLMIQNRNNIYAFFDSQMKAGLFEGQTWRTIVESILHLLPGKIYISLDVDGLSQHLFPRTGTPVPGGLSFEQVEYLLIQILKSGRQVICFDLVEVASPDGECDIWDGQAGARLLYTLSQLLVKSG